MSHVLHSHTTCFAYLSSAYHSFGSRATTHMSHIHPARIPLTQLSCPKSHIRPARIQCEHPSQLLFVPHVPSPIFVQRTCSARIPLRLSCHASHIRRVRASLLAHMSQIRPERHARAHPFHLSLIMLSLPLSLTHTRLSLSHVSATRCAWGRVPGRTSSCPSGC